MSDRGKPLVWLHGEVKTPPLSRDARRHAGLLLRRLQSGELIGMPDSRPMPDIGPRCHELRISDAVTRTDWRIVYRFDKDAIVVGDVFKKSTRATPKHVIATCRRRFQQYDSA